MQTICDLLKRAYTSWDDAETLCRVGRELHDRNRLDHAREALGRAVELEPAGGTDRWEYLSYTWFRAFEGEKGEEILRRGIEATGSDSLKSTLAGFSADKEEAERLRGEIAESEDPDVKAGAWWKKLYEGEAQQAYEAVKALWEEHTDNEGLRDTFLWMLLGAKNQGVEGLDLRETGVPLAQKMIDEDPTRVRGYWMKLQLLTAEKDWDGVLATTEEALSHLPDEETVMQLRGRAFREKEDDDRAVQWFTRAVGAKPSFAGARVDLGRLYEKQGKLELAEEVFLEIPKANPGYAPGPMSMALFCARQGRLDEAEEIFLATWPNLPEWFKGSLVQNAEAKPLLEHEAVKALIEEKGSESES